MIGVEHLIQMAGRGHAEAAAEVVREDAELRRALEGRRSMLDEIIAARTERACHVTARARNLVNEILARL